MTETAEFLFKLLDDIDTVSDIVKGDDAAYREAVERIQRRRFEVASTDGYSVTFAAAPPAPVDHGKRVKPLADATHCGGYPVTPPATSPEREEALTLAAWCRDEMQGYVKNAPEHAVLGRIEALLRRIAGGA
jgi:hypothetical protein